MNNSARPRNNFVYLLIVIAIGAIIFTALRGNAPQGEDVPLSQIATMINSGQIKTVSVTGDEVKVIDSGGNVITSHKDPTTDLPAQLKDLGVSNEAWAKVKYAIDRPPEWGTWLSTLMAILGM